MRVTKSEALALLANEDVVRVRQAVKRLMVEQRFSLVDQNKMVTAASELARNAVFPAGPPCGGGPVPARNRRYLAPEP